MNFSKLLITLLIPTFFISCSYSQNDKILVFSKTAGYRHKSIEAGIAAIKELGKKNSFTVVATEDADYFSSDSLKKYDAIVFLSTTGNIFNSQQEQSFKKFIQTGGGFVGIHAATDTEYDWEWYGKLVGAYFESHPPGLHQAEINIVDTKHQSTKNLPKIWSHNDEWYNFKNLSKSINVLANLDESTYVGGKNGSNHPISWYQEYDGGKMFYTGLGHTKEAYTNEKFLAHILGGIQYVLEK